MVAAYRAIGQEISVLAAVVVAVFGTLANFFTLTPNNIGVQELLMAYLYSLFGVDFTAGILGASLMRAVHLALTFTVGPILGHWMLRRSTLTFSSLKPGARPAAESPRDP